MGIVRRGAGGSLRLRAKIPVKEFLEPVKGLCHCTRVAQIHKRIFLGLVKMYPNNFDGFIGILAPIDLQKEMGLYSIILDHVILWFGLLRSSFNAGRDGCAKFTP